MNTSRWFTATFVTACLCVAGTPALADHHEMAQPFTGYYSFSTDQPAAVVAAFRAFAASDCRKAMPTRMTLMGNLFNGEAKATHTMIWADASIEDMSTGFQVFGECRAAAVLGRTLAEATEPVAQTMGMPIIAEGDPEAGNVYTVWRVVVTDEAKYGREYTRLMEAQKEAGLVNGPYGVVRVIGGRRDEATHVVYAGSPSLAEHFSGQGPGDAFMRFQRAVADIRTVTSTEIAFRVADF